MKVLVTTGDILYKFSKTILNRTDLVYGSRIANCKLANNRNTTQQVDVLSYEEINLTLCKFGNQGATYDGFAT